MKKSINNLLIVSLFAGLASCSEPEKTNTTFHISYDDVAGFVDQPAIVSNPLAHSGVKCAQVNQETIYGPTYSRKIGDMVNFLPKKIKIKAYVRLENASSVVKMVCSIDNDSAQTVYWNALDTKTANIKPGSWELLEGELEFEGKAQAGYKLSVYPLFDKGGNTLIDDVELGFE
ncbi:MAG: hypothetical protein U0Y08_09915 [Bacteroidia bacterium]